jgi:hypothetical protein
MTVFGVFFMTSSKKKSRQSVAKILNLQKVYTGMTRALQPDPIMVEEKRRP